MNDSSTHFPTCILCDSLATYDAQQISQCVCPICNTYFIDYMYLARLYSTRGDIYNRHVLSSIARRLSENEMKFEFTEEVYKQFKQNKGEYPGLVIPKTPDEKMDSFLLYIKAKSRYPYDPITIDYLLDYAVSFCVDTNEFQNYLFYLSDPRIERIKFNYINPQNHKHIIAHKVNGFGKCFVSITVPGWQYVQKLEKTNIDSQHCFVAMRIDPTNTELENAYNLAIKPAIQEDTQYFCLRIDEKTTAFPDSETNIDDRIFVEINKAKFMVADFTDDRPNVYYEAGYAKGLGLTVIKCCNAKDVDKLHFDTRNKDHIVWESGKLDVFRQRLAYRIESEIGKGTYTGE